LKRYKTDVILIRRLHFHTQIKELLAHSATLERFREREEAAHTHSKANSTTAFAERQLPKPQPISRDVERTEKKPPDVIPDSSTTDPKMVRICNSSSLLFFFSFR